MKTAKMTITCDKCGTEIIGATNIEMKFINWELDDDKTYYRYDLCQSCWKKFKSFFPLPKGEGFLKKYVKNFTIYD